MTTVYTKYILEESLDFKKCFKLSCEHGIHNVATLYEPTNLSQWDVLEFTYELMGLGERPSFVISFPGPVHKRHFLVNGKLTSTCI